MNYNELKSYPNEKTKNEIKGKGDNIIISTQENVEYSEISSKILYKVINYDMNYKLLQTIPHKRILDLAIVFYCIFEEHDSSNVTMLIRNEHMENWGITLEEMFEVSINNTISEFPASIDKMRDVIIDLVQDNSLYNINEFPENDIEMYVLTNIYKINGAACMFYDNILQDFANSIDSNLYILPSSIHEVILIPTNSGIKKEKLGEIVKEVNGELKQQEILSDRVYLYNRDKQVITE